MFLNSAGLFALPILLLALAEKHIDFYLILGVWLYRCGMTEVQAEDLRATMVG